MLALNSKLPDKPRHEAASSSYPHGLELTDDPITPTDIATAVNDMFHLYGALPIAADMGDCLFTALDMEYTELVAPGYYATMGYGVPSGLGVQAATGRRPLILGGRWRIPDDGYRTAQLPALRLEPHRPGIQQQQLGNAARVSTGIRVQRPGQAGLCRPGEHHRRSRPGGHDQKRVTCRPGQCLHR